MGYKNAAYLKGNPFSLALHIDPVIARFTAPACTCKERKSFFSTFTIHLIYFAQFINLMLLWFLFSFILLNSMNVHCTCKVNCCRSFSLSSMLLTINFDKLPKPLSVSIMLICVKMLLGFLEERFYVRGLKGNLNNWWNNAEYSFLTLGLSFCQWVTLANGEFLQFILKPNYIIIHIFTNGMSHLHKCKSYTDFVVFNKSNNNGQTIIKI